MASFGILKCFFFWLVAIKEWGLAIRCTGDIHLLLLGLYCFAMEDDDGGSHI
jgi:hypothetical protein